MAYSGQPAGAAGHQKMEKAAEVRRRFRNTGCLSKRCRLLRRVRHSRQSCVLIDGEHQSFGHGRSQTPPAQPAFRPWPAPQSTAWFPLRFVLFHSLDRGRQEQRQAFCQRRASASPGFGRDLRSYRLQPSMIGPRLLARPRQCECAGVDGMTFARIGEKGLEGPARA